MDVWKDCRTCKYGAVRNYKFICLGKKGAPAVNPNMVCDEWKPYHETNYDRLISKSPEELAGELLDLFIAFYAVEWSEETILDWLRQEVEK